MNPLSSFIEPVGWALLHFLWQGAAIALLLRVFLWLASRSAPQLRYAAAGVALLLMFGAAVGTLWWQARGRESPGNRKEQNVPGSVNAAPAAASSNNSLPALSDLNSSL